jgi:hypothetical protein
MSKRPRRKMHQERRFRQVTQLRLHNPPVGLSLIKPREAFRVCLSKAREIYPACFPPPR